MTKAEKKRERKQTLFYCILQAEEQAQDFLANSTSEMRMEKVGIKVNKRSFFQALQPKVSIKLNGKKRLCPLVSLNETHTHNRWVE